MKDVSLFEIHAYEQILLLLLLFLFFFFFFGGGGGGGGGGANSQLKAKWTTKF